ncbi:class II fructose-bisphosphate aldolase [Duncaniella muris]|uniref:class II fructose-bisphosphate aldolase n=1 Tax=Duncaniella muris TaxID=2094150 RepID=UPI00272A6771|nr:class II fructose-bisphosphate aldolase [Duncaniella muris]
MTGYSFPDTDFFYRRKSQTHGYCSTSLPPFLQSHVSPPAAKNSRKHKNPKERHQGRRQNNIGQSAAEDSSPADEGRRNHHSQNTHNSIDPEEVIDFATRTGVDSLAISIGTSHGAYKFKPEQCTRDANGRLVPPPLAFDVLDAVMEKLPGFPIVLHGSSSVPQEYVDEINEYGGKLPDAIGIPEEELRKAAKSAVCKINIDSDSRLAMTAAVRKVMATKPAEFDPRKYLGPARDEMEKLYKHKIVAVLGSNGKAE